MKILQPIAGDVYRLDNLVFRLVSTTKRLTFDILHQNADPRITWTGDDDGDFHTFRASNGYEVISRSVMDIQTERIWLWGASKEDRAERSGSMVFGSNEKRDKAHDNFLIALQEWDDYANGVIAPPAPSPVRPVPDNVVDPTSWRGIQLESMFPGRGPFTQVYFPGSYYDQSSSTYYDRDRVEVHYECHGHYG